MNHDVAKTTVSRAASTAISPKRFRNNLEEKIEELVLADVRKEAAYAAHREF